MPEKVPHVVTITYLDKKTKRRIKVEKGSRFELVGVVGVGVVADGTARVVMPLTEISDEDFKAIAEKYGISLDLLKASVVEIKEERKGERELRFGSK